MESSIENERTAREWWGVQKVPFLHPRLWREAESRMCSTVRKARTRNQVSEPFVSLRELGPVEEHCPGMAPYKYGPKPTELLRRSNNPHGSCNLAASGSLSPKEADWRAGSHWRALGVFFKLATSLHPRIARFCTILTEHQQHTNQPTCCAKHTADQIMPTEPVLPAMS